MRARSHTDRLLAAGALAALALVACAPKQRIPLDTCVAEQVTVMPVGLCVMRTADATLFTFCPPGPLARTKARMSRSVSGISPVSWSDSGNSGVMRQCW